VQQQQQQQQQAEGGVMYPMVPAVGTAALPLDGCYPNWTRCSVRARQPCMLLCFNSFAYKLCCVFTDIILHLHCARGAGRWAGIAEL
jgi:hypothetical protein